MTITIKFESTDRKFLKWIAFAIYTFYSGIVNNTHKFSESGYHIDDDELLRQPL